MSSYYYYYSSYDPHAMQQPQQQQHMPAALKLAVYVIHAARLAGRMKNIDHLRSVLGGSPRIQLVSFQVIREDDPETLDEASLKTVTDVTTQGDSAPLGAPFDRLLAPMHPNQVSNALKHRAALTRVAHSSSDQGVHHLVVEDDVLFNEKLLAPGLADALHRAPADGGVLFLGLPSSKPAPREGESRPPAMRFETIDHFFSFFSVSVIPACDSYVITPPAALRVVRDFLPVRFPTHIHLSWCLMRSRAQGGPGVQAYIGSPNLFLDGSKLGIYTSSLLHNNRLAWNPAYMEINALVRRQQPLSDSEVERIESLRARMSLRDNPDVRFLLGMYHAKRGQYGAAAAEMQAAFDSYRQNGCLLSRSSEFVNRFCDLHVHLQADRLGGGPGPEAPTQG